MSLTLCPSQTHYNASQPSRYLKMSEPESAIICPSAATRRALLTPHSQRMPSVCSDRCTRPTGRVKSWGHRRNMLAHPQGVTLHFLGTPSCSSSEAGQAQQRERALPATDFMLQASIPRTLSRESRGQAFSCLQSRGEHRGRVGQGWISLLRSLDLVSMASSA